MKKNILLFILLIVLSLFVGCESENSEVVNVVKHGELHSYPDIIFGEVVENFIGSTRWKAIEGEDGNTYVNIYGTALFMDKEVDITLQYKVNMENSSFELNAFEMNEIPQNKLMYMGLIEKMYEGYEINDVDKESNNTQDNNTQDNKTSSKSENDENNIQQGKLIDSEFDMKRLYFDGSEKVTINIDLDNDGTEEYIVVDFFQIDYEITMLSGNSDIGHDLTYAVPEIAYDKDGYPKLDFVIEIGFCDLDNDNVKEIILVAGDKLVELGLKVIDYNNGNFIVCEDEIEGQERVCIEKDKSIIVPIGSQGLYSQYIYSEGNLMETID